jgi:acetyl esterase/lipase
MNRQEFLKALAGGAVAGAIIPRISHAQAHHAEAPPSETFVYKKAGDLEIKADVYGASAGASKPAIMWIHGGALISGSRESYGNPLTPALVKLGWVAVSIDYRLAPQTKLPAIIEDVRDAWQWMHEQAAKFGIDTARMATGGGSAGGYLTLMTGFCLNPRPRALYANSGYCDLTAPWIAEPSEFHRKMPLISKEEGLGHVDGPAVSERTKSGTLGKFYPYCRQNGLWPKEVSGHDPHTENKWYDAYCPIRNVTKQYPPAFLVHGTADTDVAYSESKNMDAKLTEAGVEHVFITIPGGGHVMTGVKGPEAAKVYDQAIEFLKAHTA